MAEIWGGGRRPCLATHLASLIVVDGPPGGGSIPELEGKPAAFTPDYDPRELYEIATKLYKDHLRWDIELLAAPSLEVRSQRS